MKQGTHYFYLIAFVLVAILASCTTGSITSPRNSPLTSATISAATFTTTRMMSGIFIKPDVILTPPGPIHYFKNEGERDPQSLVTIHDDGGQIQQLIHRQDPYTGYQAQFYFYQQGNLSLPSPDPSPTPQSTPYPSPNPSGTSNWFGANALYAPTVHLSGMCTEMGIEYVGVPTVPYLYVYDACAATQATKGVGTFYGWKIADSFLSNHNRYSAATEPSAFTVATVKQVNGTYVAMILNPNANYGEGGWDLLFTSSHDYTQVPIAASNLSKSSDGWFMFETHFDPSPCGALPLIQAQVNEVYVVSSPPPNPAPTAMPVYPGPTPTGSSFPIDYTNPFYALTPSQLASPDVSATGNASGQCTSDDHTEGSDYYKFSSYLRGSWTITSYAD